MDKFGYRFKLGYLNRYPMSFLEDFSFISSKDNFKFYEKKDSEKDTELEDYLILFKIGNWLYETV